MGNRSRGDVVADLGEQGKGPSQGRRRLQKTERDGGTASPPGPLEGRQPCSHLDVSPVRPVFWVLGLRSCEVISLWLSAAAAVRNLLPEVSHCVVGLRFREALSALQVTFSLPFPSFISIFSLFCTRPNSAPLILSSPRC